jgi:hypothetical protein
MKNEERVLLNSECHPYIIQTQFQFSVNFSFERPHKSQHSPFVVQLNPAHPPLALAVQER